MLSMIDPINSEEGTVLLMLSAACYEKNRKKLSPNCQTDEVSGPVLYSVHITIIIIASFANLFELPLLLKTGTIHLKSIVSNHNY